MHVARLIHNKMKTIWNLSKGHSVMGSGKRTRVVNMERMLFRYMINLCALSFIYNFRLRTSPAVWPSVIQISWRLVHMQRMNTNKLLRFLFSKCDIYHTVKSLRRSCSHMSQIKIGWVREAFIKKTFYYWHLSIRILPPSPFLRLNWHNIYDVMNTHLQRWPPLY